MDPELEDVLRDPELARLASLLSAARLPEPPLDDAFRSGLRRQLMEKAWDKAEGRDAWWRGLLSPRTLAWAGSAAVVVVIASVVYSSSLSTGGFTQQVDIHSPMANVQTVALHQPIVVSFTQPMDHPSTQAAVQITPATTVTYTWAGDSTLYVQPTSGDLAPNTQYQVTIGPSAMTQAGKPIDKPKSFTFVTTTPATPAPQPTPTPRNTSLLTNVVELAPIPNGNFYTPQWSADSASVIFVGAGGALQVAQANGGVKTLVSDGVSLPAIAPGGHRLAYVRGGKIEILNVGTGATTELVVAPAPTALGWVRDRLYWGSGDGIFTLGSDGPVKLAASPDPSGVVLSIAPNGAHAAFQSANSLMLLDVATGKTVRLGQVGAATTFQGWSPDGSRVIYGGGVIADMNGNTVSTLPAGDPSWSAQNQILLGSDTEIDVVRPDGTGFTKLADGTFRLPVWAPDSKTFVFLRSGALYAALAPAPPAQPSALAQASAVVTAFMQARLDKSSERASAFLDDAGKAAYSTENPGLIPSDELHFKRFYILTAELDSAQGNTARIVVRLVFGETKVERRAIEETLTLQRTLATDPFLIDAVTASAQRDLGRGPEVVAIKVTASQVEVTFDSDLVSDSATSGVSILDGQGMPVAGTVTYGDRTVTFSGLQLTAGMHYRLVVLSSVQDVGNRHPVSEYDLEFIGPALDSTSGAASSLPEPSPTQTPSAAA